MGQLRALLWKDFMLCLRHPVKIAFFYLLPLLGCFLIFVFIGLQNSFIDDCDYESFVLPPSHPIYVLTGLTCNREDQCLNQQKDYRPPYQLFQKFYDRYEKNESSMLCPGLTRKNYDMNYYRTIIPCQIEKKTGATYDDYSEEDLIYMGHVLYYPKTEDTDKILSLMAERMSHIETLRSLMKEHENKENANLNDTLLLRVLKELAISWSCFEPISERSFGFESRIDAMNHVSKMNLETNAPWAILEFNKTGPDFRYKVISHKGTRNQKSTLILQSLVESAVIEFLSKTKPGIHLEMKRLPKKAHKNPFILDVSNHIIGIAVTIGFAALAQFLASEMTFEKSSGLLKFLLLAGVPKWKVKLSWFFFGLVFCLTAPIMVVCFFKYVSPVLLDQTELTLFLFVSMLYGLALLFMCMALANIMRTAQEASIMALVLLFFSWLIPRGGMMIQSIGYTGAKLAAVRILSFLLAPCAVQIAYAYILLGERDGKPIKWKTLFQSPVQDDDFKGVGEVVIIMVLQCIFYLIISTDLFPWLVRLYKRRRVHQQPEKAVRADIEMEPLLGKEIGIDIKNLVKVYSNKKVAVDGLSLTLYKNQVTVFLGHNGAGKSTTMNILTGMIRQTNGTALIDGKDISTAMTEIRKTIGFCPQHDVVYPYLTVREHMRFYGELRGMAPDQVKSYADHIFTEMQMNNTKDQNSLSKKLSGGIRRKLSIAVAFMGNPSILILDEPTSAIDPLSRRAIWDVILSYRSKSTILISTHHMLEADLLGDRIAIMDNGSLKCYGSPMYLKSNFGSGSLLKVAHERPIDSEALETQLKQFLPVTLKNDKDVECSFSVPLSSLHSEHMIPALEYLEDNGDSLGIASFGISESTMEQVFFNVTSGAIEGDLDLISSPHVNGNGNSSAEKVGKTKPLTGVRLWATQYWATILKRFSLIKRRKFAVFLQILVLPLVISSLTLFYNTVLMQKGAPTKEMRMDPWMLGFNQTYVGFSGKTGSFLESLVSHGLGTKCMNGAGCKSCHDIINCTKTASNDKLLQLDGTNLTTYLLTKNNPGIIGTIELTGPIVKANITKLKEKLFTDDQIAILEMDYGSENDTYDEDFYDEFDQEDSNTKDLSSQMILVYPFIKDLIDQMTKSSTQVHVLWVYVDVPYNEGAPVARESVRLQLPLLNAYNNVLLRSLLHQNSDPLQYGISLYTEEVNFGGSVSSASRGQRVFTTGGILGMFSAFALMTPIFSILVVIVHEKSSFNKQLQISLGLNKTVYWLANLSWDVSLFLISLLAMIIFMVCFPGTFTQDLWLFFLVSLLYGMGLILVGYFFSFVFTTTRSCVTVFGTITPWFAFTAFILMIFKREPWYEDLNTALLLFPPYFFTESITMIDFNKKFPIPKPTFSWEMLGKRTLLSFGWICSMCFLIACAEIDLLGRLVHKFRKKKLDLSTPTNPDVIGEEKVILEGSNDCIHALETKKLSKHFPIGNRLAVDNVTFGVREGECFGLLGTNGAGKTTLFKILTGFIRPTTGDANIMGCDVRRNASVIHKHIGYCPQDDILFSKLTPIEHLHHYSRIRGIPGSQRNLVVKFFIQKLGLYPHRFKTVNQLSGGNKRKLNLAISLLNFPDVILLDEMTTGLDPEARRAGWNLLISAVNDGSSAVITSHSMDECELLCNRLVIMVNGSFKCLGGVQYLKDKFGNNYTIKLHLQREDDAVACFSKLAKTFPKSKQIEQHMGFLEVDIPAEDLKLSHLFETVHNLTKEFVINDYSISQTTLEHVFVNMVRNQT